jgi:hypothetical protein
MKYDNLTPISNLILMLIRLIRCILLTTTPALPFIGI